MTCVLDVENRAYANRAEIAHEESLLPVPDDFGHELVDGEDGGDTTEDEDEDAKSDEAGVGDAGYVGLVELAPGDDAANVHEAAKVEEHVDARVDFVVTVFSLAEVFAVPVHGVAGDETGEEIVGAEHAADADQPELQLLD